MRDHNFDFMGVVNREWNRIFRGCRPACGHICLTAGFPSAPDDKDLQQERGGHRLERIEATNEYRYYEIRIPDTRRRMLGFSLSMVVGTGLIIICIALPGDKRTGWFS
ncbi:MAG: hypothetical protein OXE17_03265 [Chloroflexi bacterium]|nr:hypothetical protein [Chloroflexota bacterium]